MAKGKKRIKLSPMEQEFVSRKTKYLMEKEGKEQKAALGQAYGMIRQWRKEGKKPHA